MILLQPILERAPLVMALVAVVGLLTAMYGFVVGLTQTDVKSSLFFATTGQLGLMFLECGLGFWQLASWHLCAHAVVRGYQVLIAPSLMHHILGNPMRPVSREIAGLRWAYAASLHRFWIDQVTDWALVKPIRKLAHDLAYFDDHVVDRAMGIPLPSYARYPRWRNWKSESRQTPILVRIAGSSRHHGANPQARYRCTAWPPG